MLMFMLPEDVERVRLIIRDYAWEEDRHELRSDKAKKARFHAEAIDPERAVLPAMSLNIFPKTSTAMHLWQSSTMKAANC